MAKNKIKIKYNNKGVGDCIGILLDYAIKSKASSKYLDFEKKSIYAKIKHYVNILNKVDNLVGELKK